MTRSTSARADGAWSAVIPVATDAVSGAFRPFVVATLPDDRIALAYVVSEAGAIGGIAITLFDGALWSPIRRVTGASIALTQFPVAIGPGIEGAVLEVAVEHEAAATRYSDVTKYSRQLPTLSLVEWEYW